MDDIDRKLLNLSQKNFPISERPFKDIGKKLDITEDEVIQRLQILYSKGVIRRIGGVFESKALGYKSCLVAAKVQPENLDKVAVFINKFPGVTHNYLRSHEFNLWFTLTASSDEVLEKIIEQIKNLDCVQACHLLPAERIFKTEVSFRV